jgi:ribosomal protein S3
MTTQLLNKNLKYTINQEEVRFLKKSLVKLKKYNKNDFLKEGVNTMFITLTQQESSKLLADFISTQLTKLKRHNFFLKFLKNALTILINNKFSYVKSVKIRIKGRFNGVPRAKDKIMLMGSGVPIITQNSDIDYSDSTSYTLNGTFGVKVWIYYKNF